MNFKEYQEKAIRTLVELESEKLALSHVALGLGSEIVELSTYIDEVNKIEEIGDMFWYLAGYCHIRNLQLSDYISHYPQKITILLAKNQPDFILNKLICDISNLQDIVKKFIAYNKSIDKVEESLILIDICTSLFIYGNISNSIDLQQILVKNIDKLLVRYPDKFSDMLAVNRNLEKEYESLNK